MCSGHLVKGSGVQVSSCSQSSNTSRMSSGSSGMTFSICLLAMRWIFSLALNLEREVICLISSGSSFQVLIPLCLRLVLVVRSLGLTVESKRLLSMWILVCKCIGACLQIIFHTCNNVWNNISSRMLSHLHSVISTVFFSLLPRPITNIAALFCTLWSVSSMFLWAPPPKPLLGKSSCSSNSHWQGVVCLSDWYSCRHTSTCPTSASGWGLESLYPQWGCLAMRGCLGVCRRELNRFSHSWVFLFPHHLLSLRSSDLSPLS